MLDLSLPRFTAAGHSAHCNRCLSALPSSHVSVDSSKLALIFYCLGTLDILDTLPTKVNDAERENWKENIWGLQYSGRFGTGFKPSSYMVDESGLRSEGYSDYDTPHLITTYTALLSLAILRDDFKRLDRAGLIKFVRSCQREDGSFATEPTGGDMDLRMSYCAFVVCALLDDWDGVDVDRALEFVRCCRTYEGGYGQAPGCESQGGPTYLALAIFKLAPSPHQLSPREHKQTLRWLIHNQHADGGFCGRTNKEADACYCFWCGAGIEILGHTRLVDSVALASFLGECQFKFGGIAKAPSDHPDPYHTYLSVAALSIMQPSFDKADDGTWKFTTFDATINARSDTLQWAKDNIRSGRCVYSVHLYS